MFTKDNLVGVRAPEFLGEDWINSTPLSLKKLVGEGKTVLVDFWTYSCVNCLRTIPHLKDWWEKYKDHGLVIVGIHTPEFEFEESTNNIIQATQDLGVAWPIINDKDYLNWHAYTNNYWPRKLLVNPDGVIVYDHIGEGGYEETEAQIRKTIGASRDVHLLEKKLTAHQHQIGSFCRPTNPETYLGYERGHYLNEVGEVVSKNENQNYQHEHASLEMGVLIKGIWKVSKQNLAYEQKNEKLTDYLQLNFSATEVNLVLDSATAKPYKLLVTLNNKPIPLSFRGADVCEIDGKTFVIFNKPRLYLIIHSNDYLSPATLKLFPLSPDFKAYAFTFGGCKGK